MKKFFIVFALLILPSKNLLSVNEGKQKSKFIGVGATITKVNTGECKVETKGEKAGEGIVYTPKRKFTTKTISYHITLRGKEKVSLKIEETDARGRFMKEKSLDAELSDNWKPLELPFTLESESSQIDVFVLTTGKRKTEFHMKGYTNSKPVITKNLVCSLTTRSFLSFMKVSKSQLKGHSFTMPALNVLIPLSK